MKLLKSTFLLLAVLGTVLSTQSCKDECDGVVCQNRGICNDGTCECPEGYTGANCESFDVSQVQALLANHTPLELVNGGVPLDNLYGKMYKEGIIFYLNADDGTGMVAATQDQSVAAQWGCIGTDIMELANITSFPVPAIETEEGTLIGDGAANTDAILAGCTDDETAAKLCRDLGPDWFLPSRGELNLMYTNLHLKGHGGFAPDWYWSSTEGDDDDAWFQFFSDGFQDRIGKDNGVVHVRAARTF